LNGKLFGFLGNLRHELLSAAKKAKIEPLSPHALRKAAGQFLIDLGVPLELVSRMLGHADTRITETVYARIRETDVVDRMMDAIDPRYARTAHRARGTRKIVETIKKLPEPRAKLVLYQVDGIERCLVEWARVSGIAKTTLFHRVVTSGMPMAEALSLGRGTRGKRLPLTSPCAVSDSLDCRTGAADGMETVDGLDALDTPEGRPVVSNPPDLPRNSCPGTESNRPHEDFQSSARRFVSCGQDRASQRKMRGNSPALRTARRRLHRRCISAADEATQGGAPRSARPAGGPWRNPFLPKDSTYVHAIPGSAPVEPPGRRRRPRPPHG
jgi:hypothetical protein